MAEERLGLLAAIILLKVTVQGQVFVVVDDAVNTVHSGAVISVPVETGPNFSDVTSLQFSLSWDPAMFDYEAVGSFGIGANGGMFNVQSSVTELGKLAFAWDPSSAMPESYVAGTKIFDLVLRALGPAGETSTISFTDDPSIREASKNFVPTTVNGESGSLTIVPEPQQMVVLVSILVFGFALLRRRYEDVKVGC